VIGRDGMRLQRWSFVVGGVFSSGLSTFPEFAASFVSYDLLLSRLSLHRWSRKENRSDRHWSCVSFVRVLFLLSMIWLSAICVVEC
jgi:hypothetical protein